MSEFTTGYLAELTAGLTAEIIKSLSGRLREKISGTPKAQAVERCLRIGLTALLTTVRADSKAEHAHLETIFNNFFKDEKVGREIGVLLRGKPLRPKKLLALFEDAGFDAATLPGINFEQALAAFATAFQLAATDEPELQGTIKTNQALAQTRLQREMLKTLRGLVAFLQNARLNTIRIKNSEVSAQPQAGKKRVVYHLKLSGRSVAINKKAKKNIVITGNRNRVNVVQKQIVKKTSAAAPTGRREAYLNRLFETCRALSLGGIDPKAASEAEARLNLEAVYTALLTLTPETHERLLRGEHLEKEARRLSALEQLNQHQRLVLLGDPGSGKTTFVNFVVLCLAGEALRREQANLKVLTAPLPVDDEDDKKKKRQNWKYGALLPIRIILRDFAARSLPDANEKAGAEHLWNFMAEDLKAWPDYAPQLHDELLNKGGLVLLDGLDEVPEANQRRVQIKHVIEDFAACFPRCRILVTSRTYAYQKQDWRLPQFSEAVLAPFSAGQIRRFVEHWYGHIGAVRGLQAEDARGRAELLKNAIFNSERLTALAERPLLLTLMASLHAWRGGSLPEKREELYNDTVDLLLDWWERPKAVREASGQTRVEQPSLAEWLKVDRQKVRELLNALAFAAHRGQPELAGTADVPEDKLIAGLMRLSNNPEVKPGLLIKYLSERAGLLLPRGVEVYTFPHRTFQEYLAACYLTDHDFPDQLAELVKADPNRWREVALLAGAKASRGTASAVWNLVEALCYRDLTPNCALTEIWGAHLAGQALVEMADLNQISARNRDKKTRVQQGLLHILQRSDFPATERTLAGNTLARLGDPRKEVMTIDQMQFCLVPAGPFWMGEEKELHRNEHLNYDYWMSRYPVTNAQFAAFVQAGGYKIERYWPEAKAAKIWQDAQIKAYNDDKPRSQPHDFSAPYHLPNHPVVGITWYEMLAFTRWLTELAHEKNWLGEGMKIELPSEAEWEKAARGGEEILSTALISSLEKIQTQHEVEKFLIRNDAPQRRYPWSDDADSNRANSNETKIGATNAVGCFSNGASPYGCEEMSGNVWEWTRSLWEKDYPYDPNDGREKLEAPDDVSRVLRGGAFYNDNSGVRCARRYGDDPSIRGRNYGFRVVVAPIKLLTL